jgi:hypothetical protein
LIIFFYPLLFLALAQTKIPVAYKPQGFSINDACILMSSKRAAVAAPAPLLGLELWPAVVVHRLP